MSLVQVWQLIAVPIGKTPRQVEFKLDTDTYLKKNLWSYWAAAWYTNTGIQGVKQGSSLDGELPGASQKESKGSKV